MPRLPLSRFLLLFLLNCVLFASSSVRAQCPPPCVCAVLPSGGVAVDCGGRGLARLPANLPPKTETLDLSNNAMLTLDDATLPSLVRLKKVVLEGVPLRCRCSPPVVFLSTLASSQNGSVEAQCAGGSALRDLDLLAIGCTAVTWTKQLPSEPISLPAGGELSLSCKAAGQPIPRITWFLNDRPVTSMSDSNVIARDDALKILSALPRNSGRYTCRASNWLSTQEQSVEVKVSDPDVISLANSIFRLTRNVQQANDRVSALEYRLAETNRELLQALNRIMAQHEHYIAAQRGSNGPSTDLLTTSQRHQVTEVVTEALANFSQTVDGHVRAASERSVEDMLLMKGRIDALEVGQLQHLRRLEILENSTKSRRESPVQRSAGSLFQTITAGSMDASPLGNLTTRLTSVEKYLWGGLGQRPKIDIPAQLDAINQDLTSVKSSALSEDRVRKLAQNQAILQATQTAKTLNTVSVQLRRRMSGIESKVLAFQLRAGRRNESSSSSELHALQEQVKDLRFVQENARNTTAAAARIVLPLTENLNNYSSTFQRQVKYLQLQIRKATDENARQTLYMAQLENILNITVQATANGEQLRPNVSSIGDASFFQRALATVNLQIQKLQEHAVTKKDVGNVVSSTIFPLLGGVTREINAMRVSLDRRITILNTTLRSPATKSDESPALQDTRKLMDMRFSNVSVKLAELQSALALRSQEKEVAEQAVVRSLTAISSQVSDLAVQVLQQRNQLRNYNKTVADKLNSFHHRLDGLVPQIDALEILASKVPVLENQVFNISIQTTSGFTNLAAQQIESAFQVARLFQLVSNVTSSSALNPSGAIAQLTQALRNTSRNTPNGMEKTLMQMEAILSVTLQNLTIITNRVAAIETLQETAATRVSANDVQKIVLAAIARFLSPFSVQLNSLTQRMSHNDGTLQGVVEKLKTSSAANVSEVIGRINTLEAQLKNFSHGPQLPSVVSDDLSAPLNVLKLVDIRLNNVTLEVAKLRSAVALQSQVKELTDQYPTMSSPVIRSQLRDLTVQFSEQSSQLQRHNRTVSDKIHSFERRLGELLPKLDSLQALADKVPVMEKQVFNLSAQMVSAFANIAAQQVDNALQVAHLAKLVSNVTSNSALSSSNLLARLTQALQNTSTRTPNGMETTVATQMMSVFLQNFTYMFNRLSAIESQQEAAASAASEGNVQRVVLTSLGRFISPLSVQLNSLEQRISRNDDTVQRLIINSGVNASAVNERVDNLYAELNNLSTAMQQLSHVNKEGAPPNAWDQMMQHVNNVSLEVAKLQRVASVHSDTKEPAEQASAEFLSAVSPQVRQLMTRLTEQSSQLPKQNNTLSNKVNGLEHKLGSLVLQVKALAGLASRVPAMEKRVFNLSTQVSTVSAEVTGKQVENALQVARLSQLVANVSFSPALNPGKGDAQFAEALHYASTDTQNSERTVMTQIEAVIPALVQNLTDVSNRLTAIDKQQLTEASVRRIALTILGRFLSPLSLRLNALQRNLTQSNNKLQGALDKLKTSTGGNILALSAKINTLEAELRSLSRVPQQPPAIKNDEAVPLNALKLVEIRLINISYKLAELQSEVVLRGQVKKLAEQAVGGSLTAISSQVNDLAVQFSQQRNQLQNYNKTVADELNSFNRRLGGLVQQIDALEILASKVPVLENQVFNLTIQTTSGITNLAAQQIESAFQVVRLFELVSNITSSSALNPSGAIAQLTQALRNASENAPNGMDRTLSMQIEAIMSVVLQNLTIISNRVAAIENLQETAATGVSTSDMQRFVQTSLVRFLSPLTLQLNSLTLRARRNEDTLQQLKTSSAANLSEVTGRINTVEIQLKNFSRTPQLPSVVSDDLSAPPHVNASKNTLNGMDRTLLMHMETIMSEVLQNLTLISNRLAAIETLREATANGVSTSNVQRIVLTSLARFLSPVSKQLNSLTLRVSRNHGTLQGVLEKRNTGLTANLSEVISRINALDAQLKSLSVAGGNLPLRKLEEQLQLLNASAVTHQQLHQIITAQEVLGQGNASSNLPQQVSKLTSALNLLRTETLRQSQQIAEILDQLREKRTMLPTSTVLQTSVVPAERLDSVDKFLAILSLRLSNLEGEKLTQINKTITDLRTQISILNASIQSVPTRPGDDLAASTQSLQQLKAQMLNVGRRLDYFERTQLRMNATFNQFKPSLLPSAPGNIPHSPRHNSSVAVDRTTTDFESILLATLLNLTLLSDRVAELENRTAVGVPDTENLRPLTTDNSLPAVQDKIDTLQKAVFDNVTSLARRISILTANINAVSAGLSVLQTESPPATADPQIIRLQVRLANLSRSFRILQQGAVPRSEVGMLISQAIFRYLRPLNSQINNVNTYLRRQLSIVKDDITNVGKRIPNEQRFLRAVSQSEARLRSTIDTVGQSIVKNRERMLQNSGRYTRILQRIGDPVPDATGPLTQQISQLKKLTNTIFKSMGTFTTTTSTLVNSFGQKLNQSVNGVNQRIDNNVKKLNNSLHTSRTRMQESLVKRNKEVGQELANMYAHIDDNKMKIQLETSSLLERVLQIVRTERQDALGSLSRCPGIIRWRSSLSQLIWINLPASAARGVVVWKTSFPATRVNTTLELSWTATVTVAGGNGTCVRLQLLVGDSRCNTDGLQMKASTGVLTPAIMHGLCHLPRESETASHSIQLQAHHCPTAGGSVSGSIRNAQLVVKELC